MKKCKFIFFYQFLSLLFYISCNMNVSQDKGLIELNKNKINADSLISIFKAFWPEIDSIEKELIKKGSVEVIISSYEGEPDEVCTYYLDTINYTLRSEFISGGATVSELRLLYSNNTIKVLKSSFSGTSAFTNQNDFEIYDYNFNKKIFLTDTVAEKLFNVQLIDFFKENTPDSVIKEFERHSSYYFTIVYNEAGVAEIELFDELKGNDITSNNWLKGNKISFYYNDKKFIKAGPYFSNE